MSKIDSQTPSPASGSESRASALQGLDRRSREIFRHIVDSYLETGEPVGSRNLARVLPMALSPASVRNVMADLEQLGLIHAPHTSAGRLPTEFGLRFFVDALLEIGDLSADERRQIEAQVKAATPGRTAESVLNEASQALSGLSRGAGVVLAGKIDLRLKHVEFIRLEPGRALVVLVGEDGSVENRLVDLDPGTTPSSLIEAANYLNAHLRGRSLSEARVELEKRQKEVRAELDKLTEHLVTAGLASWADAGTGRPDTLIVRGRANLLEDVTAAERPRTHPPALRRSRNPARARPPAQRRRERRGRAHLHRLGEPAVLALRLLAGRLALSRQRAARRRRARRHRPDASQLRAHRADGGLHREGGGTAAGVGRVIPFVEAVRRIPNLPLEGRSTVRRA